MKIKLKYPPCICSGCSNCYRSLGFAYCKKYDKLLKTCVGLFPRRLKNCIEENEK